MTSPLADLTVRQRAALLLTVAMLAAVPLVALSARTPNLARGTGSDIALVAAVPVEVQVREIQLTGAELVRPRKAAAAEVAPAAYSPAATRSAAREDTVLTSKPQTASGYATVGVTWAQESGATANVVVWARTQIAGKWGGWTDLEYDGEHGPDASTPEGRRTRAGTDPFPVGEVDLVQVKIAVRAGGSFPRDLKLSIVDPGVPERRLRQKAALVPTEPGGDAALTGAGGVGPTERPAIFSRAQWGADESLRDASSLHYGRVQVGFVHHTVNANDYTREQVPALLRGIYAYHTRSKGWSDIGYNFVVDRFGRIWEGRYGGVDRAVVGAHTRGYNENAFAASALGNLEVTRPSEATLDAYARLFAWKLSLHGARPDATVSVGGEAFATMSGHSDAGSTACPGRYLYARLGDLRKLAATTQHSFGSRALPRNLQGTAGPDLVMRDAASKRLVVLRTGRRTNMEGTTVTNVVLGDTNLVLVAGDWNRDGRGDVVSRRASDGQLLLRTGAAADSFNAPTPMGINAARLRIIAVGDLSGDGNPDLVSQDGSGTRRLLPGNGRGGVRRPYVIGTGATSVPVGVGTWGADGSPDLVERSAQSSTTVLRYGNGPGHMYPQSRVLGGTEGFTVLLGAGDGDGDGHPDLFGLKRATGELWLIPGTATAFASPRRVTTGLGRYDLVG